MNETEAAGPSPADKKYLSVRQAAFIGVGAMVGAGIFALLGAAGEVAGAAVWLSFLLAGFVAGLQGYSFAKLGARYPSAGGLLEYVAKATPSWVLASSPSPPRIWPSRPVSCRGRCIWRWGSPRSSTSPRPWGCSAH
jgi:amino acid transporter